MTRALFLHYGPGGNCDIEKKWLGSNENIEFWDQPTCSQIHQLEQAVEARAFEFQKSHGELNIIAHSFGCDLALKVAANKTLSINKMILISPVLNLPVSFLYLAQSLINKTDVAPELREQIKNQIENKVTLNIEEFWPVIGLITQYQNFSKLYWQSQQNYNHFMQLNQTARPLNFTMWQAVLNTVLSRPKPEQNKLNIKSLEIFLGDGDPYYNSKIEKLYLQELFPIAKVSILECGHHPHLETNCLKHWTSNLT